MAMSIISEDHRIRVVSHMRENHPEICNNSQAARFFEKEFEFSITSMQLTTLAAMNRAIEVTHHTFKDVAREEIIRKFSQRKAIDFDSRRAEKVDWGEMSRYQTTDNYAKDRASREYLKRTIDQQIEHDLDLRQEKPIYEQINAIMQKVTGCKPLAAPKKKSFIEQLEADVKDWLSGALELTHLKGAKLDE